MWFIFQIIKKKNYYFFGGYFGVGWAGGEAIYSSLYNTINKKRGNKVGGSDKSSTNQIKVVKDESGFVHLPKNK